MFHVPVLSEVPVASLVPHVPVVSKRYLWCLRGACSIPGASCTCGEIYTNNTSNSQFCEVVPI